MFGGAAAPTVNQRGCLRAAAQSPQREAGDAF